LDTSNKWFLENLAFPENNLIILKPENEKGTTILFKCPEKKKKKRSWVLPINK
jgi:hypothetical protein